MRQKQFIRRAATLLGAGFGLSVGSYAVYAGATWLRYGRPRATDGEDSDRLLDVFMPTYDVVDRHKICINAPHKIALSAAAEMDLQSSAVIRAIFKTREWILRSRPDDRSRPRGFLAEMKFLGWGSLAELPEREIVMGSVTKPWEPNPIFRALPPDEFAGFDQPGYVKIIWTLRADPIGDEESLFRTETRAVATDAGARKKFRWYWSLLSPGIIAIRSVMLSAVKADAENRYRAIAA